MEDLFPDAEINTSTWRLNEDEQLFPSCAQSSETEVFCPRVDSITDDAELYPFGPIRTKISVVSAFRPVEDKKPKGYPKIAARLFALSLLFSGYIPARCPPEHSKEIDVWEKLKEDGKLVEFLAVQPCRSSNEINGYGKITVIVRRKLDVICRLIAINGLCSPLKWQETKQAMSTHIRWWTDSPICSPIKTNNMTSNGGLNEKIKRSVTLPWEFLEPWYNSPSKLGIIESVAVLYQKIFEIYTRNDPSIKFKINNGIGGGRGRIEGAPLYEEALKEGIQAALKESFSDS